MTRKYLLVLVIALAPVVVAPPLRANGVFDYGDPSPVEQLMLEILNRARADPEAERVRLGIPDGDWLPGYPAQPPLAMNALLTDAARAHALDMHDRLFFDHVNPDGDNANDRVRAAGYALGPEYAVGANNTENIAIGPTDPGTAHASLFVDESDSPLFRHRRLILSDLAISATNDVVGIGIFEAPSQVIVPTSNGDVPTSHFYAQEFAHDADATPFVLGVAYRDQNGDGRYDLGEGLGGVTVATDKGSFQTTTASAGGFAIPIDVADDYTLTASGGDLPEPIEHPFSVSDENVKVDFVLEVEPDFEVLKSVFKVNFKKRAKGINADVLVLKALLDKGRFPESLDGVSVTIRAGDAVLGPYTLELKGKKARFRSPKGETPKVKVDVKIEKGLLVFKTAKADLMAGLGVVDETATGTKDIVVRVTLGDRYDAEKTLPHALKSKEGRKAKGKFVP